MNKIQSISNIITNSSSEVFIISTNSHEEVIQFLAEVCDVLGYNFNTIACTTSATRDGDIEGWESIQYSQGDLIIESTWENSIPWMLVDLIGNLDCLPKTEKVVTKVKRHHLG